MAPHCSGLWHDFTWLSHDQADTMATHYSHCITVTWLSLFEIRSLTFHISNSSSSAALWPPESHCWVPACQPSKSYLQSTTPTIVLWPCPSIVCPHTELFPGENHTTPSYCLLCFSCSGANSEGNWLCTGGKEDMGENAVWDKVCMRCRRCSRPVWLVSLFLLLPLLLPSSPPPFLLRAAIILKIADLASTKYRSEILATAMVGQVSTTSWQTCMPQYNNFMTDSHTPCFHRLQYESWDMWVWECDH